MGDDPYQIDDRHRGFYDGDDDFDSSDEEYFEEAEEYEERKDEDEQPVLSVLPLPIVGSGSLTDYILHRVRHSRTAMFMRWGLNRATKYGLAATGFALGWITTVGNALLWSFICTGLPLTLQLYSGDHWRNRVSKMESGVQIAYGKFADASLSSTGNPDRNQLRFWADPEASQRKLWRKFAEGSPGDEQDFTDPKFISWMNRNIPPTELDMGAVGTHSEFVTALQRGDIGDGDGNITVVDPNVFGQYDRKYSDALATLYPDAFMATTAQEARNIRDAHRGLPGTMIDERSFEEFLKDHESQSHGGDSSAQ